MSTNLPSCFFIQFLEQLLKFPVNFTFLKYVMSQRSYGFLITKADFWLPNFGFKRSLLSLLNCLFLGTYNVKTIKSNCNLKTDLDRAKVGHSFDMIFVSLAKLFNKNSKL